MHDPPGRFHNRYRVRRVEEKPGPLYAAIAGGTAISYLIFALTHLTGAVWLIPVPVAAAAAALVALTTRRR